MSELVVTSKAGRTHFAGTVVFEFDRQSMLVGEPTARVHQSLNFGR